MRIVLEADSDCSSVDSQVRVEEKSLQEVRGGCWERGY